MTDTTHEGNNISNVEIRLKLASLESLVASLIAKAAIDSKRDVQFAAMKTDIGWMKWFILAQAAATIGMLGKLFVG